MFSNNKIRFCFITFMGLLLTLGFSIATAFASNNSLETISKRIAPVGQVYVEVQQEHKPAEKINETLEATKTTEDPIKKQKPMVSNGEKIYSAHCQLCHASGAAGAPKLEDSSAWQTRSKQGVATLLEHAIKGYKIMPPKGGCASCSHEDIKDAVNFMLKQAKVQT